MLDSKASKSSKAYSVAEFRDPVTTAATFKRISSSGRSSSKPGGKSTIIKSNPSTSEGLVVIVEDRKKTAKNVAPAEDSISTRTSRHNRTLLFPDTAQQPLIESQPPCSVQHTRALSWSKPFHQRNSKGSIPLSRVSVESRPATNFWPPDILEPPSTVQAARHRKTSRFLQPKDPVESKSTSKVQHPRNKSWRAPKLDRFQPLPPVEVQHPREQAMGGHFSLPVRNKPPMNPAAFSIRTRLRP
ncbi:hypothetical protein GQ43DRAFT_460830 [Delitschia confertaspora ATCC 74209]|uniref:Uncharacterized protein n=1 Tax=Delitschia confertaspora ATCC 74209 TaxID=1513339 RepID=A0A9P4JRS4_9PLEO|nr:hypothetical protein GQ43DRAFT_460830 [Delitschia confertaspora ATCC 74209]